MTFNKTLLKNLYDNKVELFSNIQLGNTPFYGTDLKVGTFIAAFYRGCFKYAIEEIIEHNVPLSSMDYDEWLEYYTDEIEKHINLSFYSYLDNFYLIIDDYYVRKSGYNLIHDRDTYLFAKKILKDTIYDTSN